MIKNGDGNIIVITSARAFNGGYGRAAYCASKAGQVLLPKTLAIEWARYGILVTGVAPGEVITEETLKRWQAVGKDDLALKASKIPLGRLGTTDDVARTCLFLASDESSYITGEVLRVDGGRGA